MYRCILLAGALLSASTLSALGQEFTASQLVERAVITGQAPDGTAIVEFERADRVQPGDALVYKLNYTNGTADTIQNAKLVMAVPAEVIYNENSAAGENTSVAFSTDGGQSFFPRGELTVSSDGAPRAATSDDITHIRWSFSGEIVAGEAGTVTYGAVVR